ncbi:hypothetical protein [Halarcobacter anaerophilus]|jgi:hypothetical protein|uniref:hypothetical protein n=1 Tax=Halarcobacter anaerophilus TaxID=877500 RepID=UPI0005CB4C01|nr:hypothetical protein [Halarcobacter anaerophilus]
MQIMFVAVIIIAFLAFVIYKINNRFATKELITLIAVIIVTILVVVSMMRNQEEKVPLLFKQKYEQEKNVVIEKLSFERLNNRNVSSKTNFIYNFDYIIKKDGKEFLCKAKNIKIKKIEDEYVFENFHNLKENCIEK